MPKVIDILAFIAMASSWALNYPLVKFALVYQSPMSLVFFRVFLAAVFSFIFFRKKIKIPRDLKTNLSLLIFSFLNMTIFMSFWFLGEQTESSSISSIIIYTYPVLSILFSVVFLKEKLSGIRALGVIFGFIGIILIFLHQLTVKPGIGLFFLAIGAASWALGTIYFKKYLQGVGNYTVNALQFAYSIPFLLLIVVPTGSINFSMLTPQFLIIVLYMGSLSTAVAYFIYIHLYSKYSVSDISSFFFAVPALSVIFSYFLLNENNSLATYLGFFMISLGIFLSSRKQNNGIMQIPD